MSQHLYRDGKVLAGLPCECSSVTFVVHLKQHKFESTGNFFYDEGCLFSFYWYGLYVLAVNQFVVKFDPFHYGLAEYIF